MARLTVKYHKFLNRLSSQTYYVRTQFCVPCRQNMNLQWNPKFSSLQGKRKLIRKIDWGEGTDFWFELSGGSKNEGLRSWDFTECKYRLSIRSISRKLSRNFAETQGCYLGCAGAGLGWSSSGVAASVKSWRLFTRLLPAGSLCCCKLPRDSQVSQLAGYKVVRNIIQCNISFITTKTHLVDTKHRENSLNSACCS